MLETPKKKRPTCDTRATRGLVRVLGMAGFVYTHATQTRDWYLEEIRQRYGQTLEEYQKLLEETRMRQFERDLEIERERIEDDEEEEEECTTDDDDDDYDDEDDDYDSFWEGQRDSGEDELSDDEFPAPVPPRRGAAADKLREASELLFEHKDCLPEGVYLKIFDALKCQWDGDYVAD